MAATDLLLTPATLSNPARAGLPDRALVVAARQIAFIMSIPVIIIWTTVGGSWMYLTGSWD